MNLLRRTLSLGLVLLFFLTSLAMPVYADYTLPQYVRIGLMYGSGTPKTLDLESAHGFLLGTYDEREFTESNETSETALTVTVTDGNIQVSNSSGKVLASGETVGIKPNASGKEQKLLIDGVEYRGAVDCIAAGDAITVINVVFLDHYLYGVISREMSPSWHIEALKAQAVCARNYVSVHLNKHADQGFDLCSGVHCQAYSGTNVESDRSYAPVDETTRQVLTYNGKLAELYYSSSMGPTTEDVKNVWGNAVPYLISVDNRFEDTENIPNGKWTGTLTRDEATTIMRNKGYDIGDVTKIEVLEYTANGRVLKMEVAGTSGSKVFEREACRTLFNTVTKSQMFTVTGNKTGEKTSPQIQVTDGTNTKDCKTDQLVILTAEGRFDLAADTLYVSDGKSKKSYTKTTITAADGTTFYFEGTGWGHSIGMSQYGAKGMAEKGYSYIDILLHYFPGTNLENAVK